MFTWGYTKGISCNEPHVGQGWAFSEVTGGRAPSFHDLSLGEAPAPSVREGNGGGGKFPSQISRRKDQPGRLGTEEMAQPCPAVAVPCKHYLNVTKAFDRKTMRRGSPDRGFPLDS